ncbi:polyphosphate kinase 1 [Pseudobacter ginsenosidimutans]|uniref:Polyphosphate kinase n=1 Tax=Pseudobacter ginsenosidimutans TaxID=661488 RepID=A0A4Q7MT28_9BACT|nr:polyphosphate kinase 1 [Pseudobacter ginsenosidimutans]QEC41230.1 polyphosphate kinase 1 [Pseudobacter ginsenosidimutans]RZS71996.1 polyphosphate kinase [Pseudobacter ginsenosidimutans]
MSEALFFDRDLSWLSFNERVLQEAGNIRVPLLERIRFLSIYSSNSDEFYRVRMPALMALERIHQKSPRKGLPPFTHVQEANQRIHLQQQLFGNILRGIIPELKETINSELVFNRPIPEAVQAAATEYFFTQVLAFLQPQYLSDRQSTLFPENNKIYLAAIGSSKSKSQELIIVNVPSDALPRFYTIRHEQTQYILFLEDIIRYNLQLVMPQVTIESCYSFKVTRDAALELADEYEGDLAEKIERQIAKRDFGFATRLLYGAGTPPECLQALINLFNLEKASIMEGGVYHNLKDLAHLPIRNDLLEYPHWPVLTHRMNNLRGSLLEEISQKDIILHAPYQSFNTVLRFFNEAALDPSVEEIYVTLYRIASDSRIATALISAARNGKKVVVFVELKARFDEANNLRWSRKLKDAGVRIIYSIPTLKVHAKVALVKRMINNRPQHAGLLATGNLNESTARFYTDHILLTAHMGMLAELEQLFLFLSERKKPLTPGLLPFAHLLIAQFNLLDRFIHLIDREIDNARNGLPAGIIIKLNNLEEKVLINKLYEASNAGVRIQMIVRSICCLIPGIPGMSENITIRRIVDRYLEHGRVFIFKNNNDPQLFMGSSDWMNRNIYRRIEVCFPVYNPVIKTEIMELINLQLKDNVQAVQLNSEIQNIPIQPSAPPIRSQQAISELLNERYGSHE